MSSLSFSSNNKYDLAVYQKQVFEYHFLPYFPLRQSLLMCAVSNTWNKRIKHEAFKKDLPRIVNAEIIIRTNGVSTLNAGIARITKEIRQLKRNEELKFEICMPLNPGCHFKGMIKFNAQHPYPDSFNSQFNRINREIVLVLAERLPSIQPLEGYLQDITKLNTLLSDIYGIEKLKTEDFPLFDKNMHTKGINLRLSATLPPSAFTLPVESTIRFFKGLRTPDGRSFEQIHNVLKKSLLFSETDQASMKVVSQNLHRITEENRKRCDQAINALKEAAIEQMNNELRAYELKEIWRSKGKILGLVTLLLLVSLLFFITPIPIRREPPLLPPPPRQRDSRLQKLINQVRDPAIKLKQFELLIAEIHTELQNIDLSQKDLSQKLLLDPFRN